MHLPQSYCEGSTGPTLQGKSIDHGSAGGARSSMAWHSGAATASPFAPSTSAVRQALAAACMLAQRASFCLLSTLVQLSQLLRTGLQVQAACQKRPRLMSALIDALDKSADAVYLSIQALSVPRAPKATCVLLQVRAGTREKSLLVLCHSPGLQTQCPTAPPRSPRLACCFTTPSMCLVRLCTSQQLQGLLGLVTCVAALDVPVAAHSGSVGCTGCNGCAACARPQAHGEGTWPTWRVKSVNWGLEAWAWVLRLGLLCELSDL